MKKYVPITAQNAINYMDDLNAQGLCTYAEYESGIDAVAEKMKWDIVNSASVYDASRPTFYVSNSGDDDADGRTPETAWRTTKNVNDPEKTFEGCNVLFERGGLWRERIRVPHSDMTFSAYGVGPKPRFYGSSRNFAHPSLWKKSQYPNVWYTDSCTKNVGMIAVNHSDVIGKYDEIMCYRHVVGRDGFEGPWQLNKEFDFYGHIDEAITYLYCDKGNPGEVYESIELGETPGLIGPAENAKRDLVFDNLHLRYTGCHGIAGLGWRENVTVRNCLFCYLGGSILDGHMGTRTAGFGNAIESFGECNGYFVYGNWMYQIYDTGMTFQLGGGPVKCHMDDIEFAGNLCELCHWSIEFYNIDDKSDDRHVYDVNIHHNLVRRGGYGWGSRNRTNTSALFNSFILCKDTSNFNSYCNIYDRGAGLLVRYNRGGDEKIRAFNNVYIQKREGTLGWIYDGLKPFDGAENSITELIYEERPKVFYEGE